jgi:hypothetical protein
MAYQLALSPAGRVYLEEVTGGGETMERFAEAFARSSANGLLALAGVRGAVPGWPAEGVFWREFASAFLHALAQVPETDGSTALAATAPDGLFFSLTLRIPAMRGAEYAGPEVFASLWREMEAEATVQAKAAGGLKAWLGKVNPALHLLGRVTFHLAENKRSPVSPFAFMATFTHRLSAQEKPVHLPLARALEEYAGAKNQAALRALLEPVQRASERSGWARTMLESRRIFQPQAWSPAQAHTFLKEAPALEECGIVVRIPNWWRGGKGPRPGVSVTIGDNKSSGFGVDSLLQFRAAAALDGEELTDEEWLTLMASQENLVLLRGRWVEVDREKLQSVLEHWKQVQAEAVDGVSFLKGMRMISGMRPNGGEEENAALADWSQVTAGGWLRETLEKIRSPDRAGGFDPNTGLEASLRPYQAAGVQWMWFLQSLGLGACLADDMGLGKTIQVIALLLQLRRECAPPAARPALLIAPASLLTNWRNELARFAPSLRAVTAHPSESPDGAWREETTATAWMAVADLVITTYTQAARLDWLGRYQWRLVVLDEAQAIKNPGARQTKAVKKLRAPARIALSGTPVENRPGDLWSLYDFLNPGLLGGAAEFSRYIKTIQKADAPDFAPLRRLVQPYILRRLKTDRSIIADLPDKTELTVSCGLSRKQAVLYQEGVREMAQRLEDADGIQRRGLVLAFLMRFKQICNHPCQWLNDGEFKPEDSGKFGRLTELCEEIASRQEKALVFTQFQEMTTPLAEHLRGIFGRPGLILHGGTPVKERAKLVANFQRDDGPPFFVLSLKAGGSGLTLTAASHVFHFDRWWNPAVENQATDRAFRIGQKRNVLVHKFVCRGTLEERIDDMLQEKRAMAESLLGGDGGPEVLLTEMDNAELLRFVSLDINTAGGE